MSVINQVLKDLDERQPLAGEQEKYSIDAVDTASPSTDYMRITVWIAAGLLVIGVVSYYLWLEQQLPGQDALQPVAANVVPAASPVEALQEPRIVKVTEANNNAEEATSAQPDEQLNAMKGRAAPETIRPESVESLIVVEKPMQKAEAKPYLPLKDDGKPVKLAVPAVKQKPKAEIVVIKTKKTGLELAREMLSGGRLTEAEKMLKDLIKEKPASLPARELLVGLLLRNNRIDEAADEIATARKYFPRSDNLVLLQAKVMLSRGQENQLTQLLQRHIQASAASQKSRALLASLHQQSGNYADAYSLYNQLAKQYPANEEYWVGLAISLDGLQQPGKARQAYSMALQSAGLSPALREYAIKRINYIDSQGNNNE